MIKYVLMLLGSALVRFVPVGFAYQSARVMGRIAYWLFRDKRRIADENLRVIFPGELDATERRRLVKSLFAHMALNTADFLRFPHSAYPGRRLEIEGIDLFVDLYRKGGGVILVSPHVGNWEVGGMLLAEFGFPVNVVTESIRPRKTRFKGDRTANLYRRRREAVGMKTIPLERSGIREFRALKRGEILALVADRDISGSGEDVEFFNMKSRVPKGPAVLALRTGAPIFVGVCVRSSHNRLHGIFEPVRYDSEDVHELTQLLVKKMEHFIKQYPDQWFVFQPPWS
jgi:KDO2-lipid IV(A) lauroyltransferase